MNLRSREITIEEGCGMPLEFAQWQVPLEALIPAIHNICRMPSPTADETLTPFDANPTPQYDAATLVAELSCSVDRLQAHTETLSKVGFTPYSFIALYAASLFGTRREQENLIKRIEKPIHSQLLPEPFDASHRSPDTRCIHKQIIRDVLGPLIAKKEFDPESKQKIVMIVGPFAAGKTEIFEQNYSAQDFFMLDLDIIRDTLARAYGYDNVTDEAVIQKFRRESWFLSDMLFRIALRNKLSVVIQTSLHRKERWLNDTNLLYAKEHGIPIEMVVILRPIHDLIFRALHRKRGVLISDMNQSLRGMANIKKFVQKFGNINKVLIYDFYPEANKRHGKDTRIYSQQYKDFLEYVKKPFKTYREGRENLFSYVDIQEDILVVG